MDGVQCQAGFTLSADGTECLGTETAERPTTSDTDATLLIGVVAGCVAVLALTIAGVYVVKSTSTAGIAKMVPPPALYNSAYSPGPISAARGGFFSSPSSAGLSTPGPMPYGESPR